MISLELFRTAVAQLPIQQFPARAFSKVSQGLNSLCCEAVDALLPAKCVFQIPMFTKKFYPHLRPFSLLWGVGGERKREMTETSVGCLLVLPIRALTRNMTRDTSVHWMTLQPTEPHRPGLKPLCLNASSFNCPFNSHHPPLQQFTVMKFYTVLKIIEKNLIFFWLQYLF